MYVTYMIMMVIMLLDGVIKLIFLVQWCILKFTLAIYSDIRVLSSQCARAQKTDEFTNSQHALNMASVLVIAV
jgi:hypothetical protein